MTVTELAFLRPTRLIPHISSLPPSYRTAISEALTIQDAWCAAHLSSLTDASSKARGAALFQQLEDPSVTMLTAHWDSVAEHQEWIASAENRTLMERLVGERVVDGETVELLHVDGVAAFSDASSSLSGTRERELQSSEERGEMVSTLHAPIVSVARFFVEKGRKAEFEEEFKEVRWILDEFAKPYVHRGGWRVEKGKQEGEEEDREEFVLIGGRGVRETAGDCKIFSDFGASCCEALRGGMLGCEVRNYRRVL